MFHNSSERMVKMGVSEWCEIICTIITSVTVFIAFCTYLNDRAYKKKEEENRKAQNTYNMISELQESTFSFLYEKGKEYYSTIAENSKKTKEKDENGKNGSQKYKEVTAKIAAIDRFAYSIDKKFCDYGLVKDICGSHLYYIYRRVEPVIKKAREVNPDIKCFENYEKLVKRLKDDIPGLE